MSGPIFIPAYWPNWQSHQLIRFDYSAPEMPPFTSVFSYDAGSDSMIYSNYDANLNFLNKWWYRYNVGFGICEYRDDYPNNKVIVMNPGIGWGEFQSVGSVYQNKPKFDLFRCSPPAMGSGLQIVAFESLLSSYTAAGVTYDNVLVFSYLQSWNGKPATGARYFMQLGLGPVATQFITQDATDPTKTTETVIWEAKVTRVNA